MKLYLLNNNKIITYYKMRHYKSNNNMILVYYITKYKILNRN
jgi:transcription initiation factor IIE alpha subunit